MARRCLIAYVVYLWPRLGIGDHRFGFGEESKGDLEGVLIPKC